MSWASRVAEMPNSFVRGAHLRTRRPEYIFRGSIKNQIE